VAPAQLGQTAGEAFVLAAVVGSLLRGSDARGTLRLRSPVV
jgi:hypothetical protein